MAAELAFGLLGPLEVRRDGVPVPIAAGRQRALLAALLLNTGTVILADDLIDVLWDCGPPVSARAALHNYVRRLRQALGDAAHERVVTRPQGYLIGVAAGTLDVTRFGELLATARVASQDGEWEHAAGQARAALALWRGEPLADTGSDVLASREGPRLAELRMQATELSLEAGLRLGQLAEAIGELRSLVARHPLRERLHGLLMLALYLDGRQGEALATYQQLRAMLIEELGADPGPGLRELHQQILTADPSLVPIRSGATMMDGPAASSPRPGPSAGSQPGRHIRGQGPGRPPGRLAVDVFPVTIGHYADPGLADLDAEARAGRLVDLLASFGGQHRRWAHPARERGADAVQRRLRDWSRPGEPLAGPGPLGPGAGAGPVGPVGPVTAGGSVLYWAGHGWSDGTRTVLAHGHSPAQVGESGLESQQLAQAIRARQAAAQAGAQADKTGVDEAGGWALVVIEASHATEFADAVMACLHGRDAPSKLLLVAVPPAAVPAGGFVSVLASLLADTYRTERQILLRDLAGQLERVLGAGNVYQRGLGEAALVRTYPPAASLMSVPVDTSRFLDDVLADLSADERSHFLIKAQGAEHGELSWFFEGREDELAQISAWLHQDDSGLLVVAGPAGAGKSALLGNVFVRSLPGLRDALARRGLITAPESGSLPPDGVFDAVIHLSGLTLSQATLRVAGAAGLAALPSHYDRDAGVASDLDFLADELARRTQPFTVLADALDEAADPLDTARSLLARIAALRGVRILVGTRASTHEAPDTPAGDDDLLQALGAGPGRVLWVRQDKQAIARYVAGRLRAARDYGVAGSTVPYMSGVSDQDIQDVAVEVAGRGQEFLFARLAVYELIADPRLLTPGMTQSRRRLLGGTHQDLFGRAVHRLASHDDRYPVLMRALALARGRGLPEADGLWATIAAALGPLAPQSPAHPGRDTAAVVHGASGAAAWAMAISGLLDQAAAYITAGTSAAPGGPPEPGTVYRLAHHTFVEYFARPSLARPNPSDARQLAASALLQAAEVITAGSCRLPYYLIRHLSGHVAQAGIWDDLAALPRVLDRIDPNAVTADAIRTLFGRHPVPPPIAGIIGARDTLAGAQPADRPGLRQLATTIHSPQQIVGEPVAGWGIAAAQAGRSTVHVRLSGHAGAVNTVRSLSLPGGRILLASCSDDGSIRLWDPVTATPVGVPMKGHVSTVEDICVLPGPGAATRLASAGADGTVRLWDPATGQRAAPPLTGHTGPVWGVCAVPGRPGEPPNLASAGDDGTVRLWDLATGQPAGPPLTGHIGHVLGVCAVPGHRPGQRPTLASAGADGTVRLWDPATGQPAAAPLTGHARHVRGLCVVPGHPGQPPVLASTGADGTVRLWDPATGQPAAPPLTGHTGHIWGVCAVPGHRPGQPSVLASAGNDGTVRLWDPATGQPAAPPLTGHIGPVFGVCVVPGHRPGQPPALATAGADGTVRLWDLATGQPSPPPLTGRTGHIWGVGAVPGHRPGQPAAVASAGSDGTVRLWDVATGQPAASPLTGHTGIVRGVCVVPGRRPGQPSTLASAAADSTVQLWDLATGQPAAPPLTGHTGMVRGVCVVPGHRPALASAGADGTVRLWDLATGQPAGPPLTGHTGPVNGVCAVPGRPLTLASAGADGTVRLWDLATGQPAAAPLTGHTGPVNGVCAVPGHRPGQPPTLASAGNDGTVRLWDLATGQPTALPLTGHTGPVFGVCVAPGHRPGQPPTLASAGADGTVRLWDLATGQPAAAPLAGHTGPVLVVCAVPGHRPGQPPTLASAGADGTVRLWDALAGLAVGEPLVRSPTAVNNLASCDTAAADCLCVHGDGTVRTWTAATAALRPVTCPPDVSAIATVNSAGHLGLLTGDVYGQVHHSRLRAGGRPSPPLPIDNQAVLALCPLPGPTAPTPAARVAAAGGSGTITIITVSPGGQLEPGPLLVGCQSPIRALCLASHPDGDGPALLAAAGNDATIWIWDLAAIDARGPAAPLADPLTDPLTGHEGWIWALAAVPATPSTPLRLASAGADHTIRLWDPLTGDALGPPLTGHTGQVRALITATSRDGQLILVSGGHDGTIRLWDPVTGTPAAVIPLGIPVHALLQQPTSQERTGGGTTITVGLRTGILTLDVHHDMFPRTKDHPRIPGRRRSVNSALRLVTPG